MNAWFMRPLPMTLTASSAAEGHDPAYAGNDIMGVVWKPTAGAAPKLFLDLGSNPNPVDAILLFGVGGTASRLRVRAASNSGFTTSVYDGGLQPLLAGDHLPTHGLGVGWWTKDDGAIERRYWELEFSAESGNVAPTIARVVIGQRIVLDRNFAFGGGWGVRDLGKVEFAASGALLRRRAAKQRTLGLTFPAVHKDEVEAVVQPMVEGHGGQEPIALVTDPAADPFRQRRCWYGPLIGDLGTIWPAVGRWEWRASLIDLVPIPAGPSWIQQLS